MFDAQGPGARSIAGLGWTLLITCLVVYVIVMAGLAGALLRTRHPSDDSPSTTKRLTRIVAAAVAVSALILVALTAASAAVGRGLTAPDGSGALRIAVVGHQWWWDFQYRNLRPADLISSPNELHLPVGVPVALEFQSRDVIHSFWVPNLQGKRDLIPGMTTTMRIQADRAGIYRGQCAEFCGHQHATMAFTVVVEPMEQFQAWIERQRQPALEPATDQERRGRDVFLASTCATCHAITGTLAGSRVGPDLTHVGSRLTIAAGTLPNTFGHLRQWVADPTSVRPGVRMPSNALAKEDLDAVVSYLGSLR